MKRWTMLVVWETNHNHSEAPPHTYQNSYTFFNLTVPIGDKDTEWLELYTLLAEGRIRAPLYPLLQWNTHLPGDPASPPPVIRSRKKKSYVHPKICVRMFIATLFITAPNWKWARLECREKPWDARMVEYNSAMKRSEPAISCGKTDASEIHLSRWKKPDPKGYLPIHFYDLLEKAEP